MKLAGMMTLVLLLPSVALAAAGKRPNLYFTHQSGNATRSENDSKNFGNEVIYQIVVDRFADGNKANNCFFDSKFCAAGLGSQDFYRYMGGDLRGVINHLDYLKNLGVTRIWLTPIFENEYVTAAEPRFGTTEEITSYHGYWTRDWLRLNPFFTDHGSQDAGIVEQLIDQGKHSGISVYLDTVVNHTGPINPTTWSLNKINVEEPLACDHCTHRGALFKDGKYFTSYDEDVFLKQTVPSYSPKFHQMGRNIGDVHGDSDWADPFICENYNLSGLADLSQDESAVANYVFEAHKFWLSKGVAGFRIDTIKHVSHNFWRRFSSEIYGAFPQTESFGEYFNGGPQTPSSRPFYRETRMSMLDFNFREFLRRAFLENGSFYDVLNIWQNDQLLGDARSLITFLDSHDFRRLRGEGMSLQRMRQATALWFMARGVPNIYYGLEQDLFVAGDPGDPFNRPMMKSFDEQSEHFVFLKRLIQLRRDHKALRFGDTAVAHISDSSIVFTRNFEGDHVLFATAKNSGRDLTLKDLPLPEGAYRDIYSGREFQIRNGTLALHLAEGEILVLTR